MPGFRPLRGLPLFAVVLVSLLAGPVTSRADALPVRGVVVDADGKPVAGVEVAAAWTASPNGLSAHGGVVTDEAGAFLVEAVVPGGDRRVALLAYDRERARGGVTTLSPADARASIRLSLRPTRPVVGALSAADGKRYPLGGETFVGAEGAVGWPVRVETVRGAYAFPLPAGSFTLLGRAPGYLERTTSFAVTSSETAPVRVETLDLVARDRRLVEGELAPTLARGAVHPDVDRVLARSHFPDRLVLFYFWSET